MTTTVDCQCHEDLGTERAEVPEAVLAKIRRVSVTTIAGSLGQLGVRSTYLEGVVPQTSHQSFAGTAFTLRTLPARADVVKAQQGRVSLHRQSFIRIGKNQVLVIDARGETGTGVLGDIYASQILMNGGVALVSDGSTRDAPAMEEVGLPIYTRGRHASGFGELHIPVDQNVPVQCAGVLVMPGDVLVGDASGVIVVPQALASQVADNGLETDYRDAFSRMKVLEGVSVNEVFPLKQSYNDEYQAWRRKQPG